MAAKIPDRLIWAVEQLAVNSGDDILEIGCGTGVAASLICSQLTNGHLTAIDKSASMVDAARRRNRVHVDSGMATLLESVPSNNSLPADALKRAAEFRR